MPTPMFKSQDLTILTAVDGMHAANGGQEVVNDSHRMDIPLGSDRCIALDWVKSNAAHQAHKAESTKEARMNLRESTESVGRVGHEAIGAQHLQPLGFSDTLLRLVNSRVAAKRYLAATDRGYYESLSSASQKSLAFQGGPFRDADLQNFEENPLRNDVVSLRLWDDAAKLDGIEAIIPRAGVYLDMIIVH
ncbi:hypothetical protein PITC_045530 [Penicillium italicum]|uniref:Uncharacterized protein n=1 Tax=Penicillium italicum TaxID=40296 RepID=A0A0A2KRZ4_PENIT|nr:hypothetical protein PITC_045530 [Penicillium italicum]